MVDSNEVPCNVPLLTMPSDATKVLERLRDSYSVLSERDALTGPDKAVLAVVQVALQHLARAG